MRKPLIIKQETEKYKIDFALVCFFPVFLTDCHRVGGRINFSTQPKLSENLSKEGKRVTVGFCLCYNKNTHAMQAERSTELR